MDLIQIKQQIGPAEAEAKDLLQAFEGIVIDSQKDLNDTEALTKAVKLKWKEIETKRTDITGPMNAALKKVNDIFQPTLKYLKQCEIVLKNKIAAGQKALLERQTIALKKLGEASIAGDLVAAREAALDAPSATLTNSTSIRTKWKSELVDIEKVPPEFLLLTVNWPLVDSCVAEGLREIPGIRIYEENIVTIRTGESSRGKSDV